MSTHLDLVTIIIVRIFHTSPNSVQTNFAHPNSVQTNLVHPILYKPILYTQFCTNQFCTNQLCIPPLSRITRQSIIALGITPTFLPNVPMPQRDCLVLWKPPEGIPNGRRTKNYHRSQEDDATAQCTMIVFHGFAFFFVCKNPFWGLNVSMLVLS